MDDARKKVAAEDLATIKRYRNGVIRMEHELRHARTRYELAIVEALDKAGADLSSRIDEASGEITPAPPAQP